MDGPEGIMLSEIHQTVEDKYCPLSLKHRQMNITKRNTLTDIKTKLAVTNGQLEEVKGKKWQGTKRDGKLPYKISYRDIWFLSYMYYKYLKFLVFWG